MAGPGDHQAEVAAGRGHLRASRADREQMIDVLKVAFVQGRLTKERGQVGRIRVGYASHSCRRFRNRFGAR